MEKKLILLMVIIVTFSCKDVKKDTTESNQESKTVEITADVYQDGYIDDTMVVIVEGVFTKDDTFQVLYTEYGSEEYSVNKLVSKTVQGSNVEQRLKYVLPKDIYPSKIRLTFGFNMEQGKILISKVIFILDNEKLVVNSDEFLTYFKPTPWINQIGLSNTAEYNLIVKDIDVNGNIISYAPYFDATEKLQIALETL